MKPSGNQSFQFLFEAWRDLVENSGPSKPHFKSHSTFIIKSFEFSPSLFLEQALCYLTEIPIPMMLFKDKTNETFFVGLGESHTLSRPSTNSDLYYFGGQSFHKNNDSEEWREFGTQKFMAPLLGIYAQQKDDEMTLEIFVQWPKVQPSVQEEIQSTISLIEKAFLTAPTVTSDRGSFQVEEIPNYKLWSEQFARAHKNLQSPQNPLEKIVLSRKVVLNSSLSKRTKDSHCLRELYRGAFDSYFYYFRPQGSDFFVSVTPEKLFSLKSGLLTVDAIAGTRKRGRDNTEDNILAKELKNSEKDLREHRFVKSHVKQKLETLGEPKLLKDETLLSLKHVQHLFSEYNVELQKTLSLEKICSALHPTPAVGGAPTEYAKAALKDFEAYERGWYSAPIGLVSRHHTEMLVGIRSALKTFRRTEETWHVYAGAGIVEGSDPQSEWEETTDKMKNFFTHLLPETSEFKIQKPYLETPGQTDKGERPIHG